jgi:hypothetical protein
VTVIDEQRKYHLLRALILLTILSVASQLFFLWVGSLNSPLIDSLIASSIVAQLLHSHIFIFGLLRFLLSHLILNALFVYLIWYLTLCVSDLFNLKNKSKYLLGIQVWMIATCFIVVSNAIYANHSFFAMAFHQQPLWDVSNTQLHVIMLSCAIMLLIICALACIQTTIQLLQKKNLRRHGVMLGMISLFLSLYGYDYYSAKPNNAPYKGTQPNIIIIGFDAVRPDFLSFYNHEHSPTPTIDGFLKSSISFSQAYAPLPRTFPSWVSILTGNYPIHHHARGNSTNLNTVVLTDTLAKTLKQHGYKTIYGTDDTRFNNTNQLFGFDDVITPPMGINDFLLGTINDFPLSNLIIPTPLGRLLFPYNYANHGAAIT